MTEWLEAESPEEREFFAAYLAGENKWRAEELKRRIMAQERRRSNLVAQVFAPEGRYAYTFDEWGFAQLTEHAREVEEDDGDYPRIRIRAAITEVKDGT